MGHVLILDQTDDLTDTSGLFITDARGELQASETDRTQLRAELSRVRANAESTQARLAEASTDVHGAEVNGQGTTAEYLTTRHFSSSAGRRLESIVS